ncbi:MAG: histidinol-phosphate transaminase [Chloroflexota bacterium]
MDTTNLVPDWIRTLIPYQPGKPIDELEREYGISDSIKIASNENPIGPSPRALAAIQAALPDLHRYPDGDAFYLKHRLAEVRGVHRDQLIIGNGSNEIIELIIRTFMRPGEEVIVAQHAFAIYQIVTQAEAGRAIPVPHKGFFFDLDAMAAAITSKTRIVFLDNPNNPTGTIYFRDAFERFLTRIPDGVVVVVDDAYAEFVNDPRYPNSLEYHRPDRCLITLRTFSKIYGLAGLRVGYGVAPPELVDAMNRVRAPFNANSLGQVAALAALDDDDHVRRTQEVVWTGLAYLRKELDRLGIEYAPSWGNFLLAKLGVGAFEKLLHEGIIVRPMEGYGFPGYARITVGLPPGNQRFVAALEKLAKAT